MNIPFCKPYVGQAEVEAVGKVILSGWLAAGEQTHLLEEEFSTYISPPDKKYYCIFTNSCTSALKMAYKYMKEVVGATAVYYPENTFCATYSAAEEMGLKAKPYKAGGWVPHQLRVNVHIGGVKDIDRCFIEDSAHRIEPNDPLVGKIRCYSFYATKNMTTGSGGMFVTDDEEIYTMARLWWRDGLSTSTHDRLSGKIGYEVQAMAGGYDGNDIAAAMGRVQLRRLPKITEERNRVRDYYNQALGQVWEGNHLYPYETKDYKELLDYLPKKGVQVSYFYPGTGGEKVYLPIYPSLTPEQLAYIVACIHEYESSRV